MKSSCDTLCWLYYNFSSNCRRIIERQYSNLFVFEKNEFRAKNFEKIQRQNRLLIETLQYQNQQLTLYLFVELLNRAFENDDQHILIAFELFEFIINFNQYVVEKNKLIREKLKLISTSENADIEWSKLNNDQRHVVDTIINAIEKNEFDLKNLFFLNDFENTNKIFVQNIVMIKLRSQNKIVLTITFFDIAAIFLDDDQTAHVRFKISLNFDNENICNIKKNTNRTTFLKTTKLIFWNEVFMQRKFDMLVISRIFSDICDVNEIVSFDDKMIIFCDDFKQTLSICFNKFKNIIIICCLQHAFFWSKIKIFRLKINMRFRNFNLNARKRINVFKFAAKILQIDNAITTHIFNDNQKNWIEWNQNFIKNNTQNDLIKIIYFDIFKNFSNVDYLSERVILIVINVDVDRINIVCVKSMRNDIHFKYNDDQTINEIMREKFFFECFHNYDELFLFFHVFRLKIDMFLMIFRNFNFSIQCNDTRVKLTRVISHVLKIEIINDKSKNELILISRISLHFKNDAQNKNRRKIVSCQFSRTQYSVRFVFAIIVNKSQNQSMRVVKIDIRTRKCFTHDQLYVVFFKIINMINFYIVTSNYENKHLRLLKNIQWKKVLLSSWSMTIWLCAERRFKMSI